MRIISTPEHTSAERLHLRNLSDHWQCKRCETIVQIEEGDKYHIDIFDQAYMICPTCDSEEYFYRITTEEEGPWTIYSAFRRFISDLMTSINEWMQNGR